MEAALDVSSLAAVIRATHDVADVGSRIKTAEKELADANTAVDKRIKPLVRRFCIAQDLELCRFLPACRAEPSGRPSRP